MEKENQRITRRDFLKVAGLSFVGVHLPPYLRQQISPEKINTGTEWGRLTMEGMPMGEIREVMELVPKIEIDDNGNLTSEGQRVPFAETKWSKENRASINPDALTVHWKDIEGAVDPWEATVAGILAGYNKKRIHPEYGYEFITSAHVTIGPWSTKEGNDEDKISILQTQSPENGHQTVSSHIRSNLEKERLDYKEAEHPMSAMKSLVDVYDLPDNYCYLLDVLKNSTEDLNRRTISLEILGYYFDDDENHPGPQLIANTVGAIFAFLEKYPNIKFSNITGHFEIQTDKSDPGKKFMAELRLILALKVLMDGNEELRKNFFAPFETESGEEKEAVKRFFDFHWDYLVSSFWGIPKEVFDWERKTDFWKIYQKLFKEIPVANYFAMPVAASESKKVVIGNDFAQPEYHEGVDLNIQTSESALNSELGESVFSTANGKVIFEGEIPGYPGLGNTIVVEHITPEGAKVLSLYAHLDKISVSKDQIVVFGQRIGKIGNSGRQFDSHLHFAIFPAATKRLKELSLYLQLKYAGKEINPYLEDNTGKIYVVPQGVNESFVRNHYLNPIPFIEERLPPKKEKNTDSSETLDHKLRGIKEILE